MQGAWVIVVVTCSLSGCLKGPGFLKQSGLSAALTAPPVAVATTEINGATTGTINAGSKTPQQITAGGSSSVAGAAAVFPPGAVAVDTQITIQTGENLATGSVASQLGINTTITSAAQPVSITSSTAMDTASPFTLAIAVPPNASLALDGDPYANLAILYHVQKASAAGADFTGLLTRDKLTVNGALVSFQTSYFGTYQAVFTAHVVQQVAEVSATPDIAKFGGGSAFYARGPLTATFGGQAGATGQSLRGLTGWVHTRSPGRVGSPTVLEADYYTKIK